MRLTLFLSFLFIFLEVASAKNLHLIDELPGGFKLYRYGQPSKKEFEEMKALGIKEVMVLSGDAYKKGNELSHGFEIVYNQKQDNDVPLDTEFLKFFDDWIAHARRAGKVIAFRCECGCHRTGRLAAYYQMKYMKLQLNDAIAVLEKYGGGWFQLLFQPQLKPQVRALHDLINGKPCSEDLKYCPLIK